MDGNVEMLEYIFQNSQMGVSTINQLLKIVEDDEFKADLVSQANEYDTINQWAKEKMQRSGGEVTTVDRLKKVSAEIMTNVNTIANKSSSHVAEMLIQGSTMGIIDATKNIKQYSHADQDILDLANKLLKFEQNNVEQLKRFL
ncbi:MAG: hypothetical protein WAX04_10850 [Oscillospiraceae bacterium]